MRFENIPGIRDYIQFEHSNDYDESSHHYSYSLADSDLLKVNTFLRDVLAQEAAKGYFPLDIFGAIREIRHAGAEKNLLGVGGSGMNRQTIVNTQRSWRIAYPDPRKAIIGVDKGDIEIQIQDVIAKLNTDGYLSTLVKAESIYSAIASIFDESNDHSIFSSTPSTLPPSTSKTIVSGRSIVFGLLNRLQKLGKHG